MGVMKEVLTLYIYIYNLKIKLGFIIVVVLEFILNTYRKGRIIFR